MSAITIIKGILHHVLLRSKGLRLNNLLLTSSMRQYCREEEVLILLYVCVQTLHRQLMPQGKGRRSKRAQISAGTGAVATGGSGSEVEDYNRQVIGWIESVLDGYYPHLLTQLASNHPFALRIFQLLLPCMGYLESHMHSLELLLGAWVHVLRTHVTIAHDRHPAGGGAAGAGVSGGVASCTTIGGLSTSQYQVETIYL